jgi:hypothetical protein
MQKLNSRSKPFHPTFDMRSLSTIQNKATHIRDRLPYIFRLLPQCVITLFMLSISFQSFAQTQTLASELKWMAGCWTSEGKEFGSGETWLMPAGGTMLGVSRTVKAGKTVAFEFMQIRQNQEGKLVFIALPSGQRETTFVATTSSSEHVIFENPRHDFPQSIAYRKSGPDTIVARIEGIRDGMARAIIFPMRRTSCEPSQ